MALFLSVPLLNLSLGASGTIEGSHPRSIEGKKGVPAETSEFSFRFCGYVCESGRFSFAVRWCDSTGKTRSAWLESDESVDGHRVIGLDRETNALLVSKAGKVIQVPMRIAAVNLVPMSVTRPELPPDQMENQRLEEVAKDIRHRRETRRQAALAAELQLIREGQEPAP